MAHLKQLEMIEIELSNFSYKSAIEPNDMPRLDLCHNCGKTQGVHVEGKCMFDASTFKPRDPSYTDFRRQFMAWASGKQIEEALVEIVYELTRRDK